MKKIKLESLQSAENYEKFFDLVFDYILGVIHLHKLGVNAKNYKSRDFSV